MYSCGKKSWAIWFEDNCFMVKEMVYLAEIKQYFLDDANLSDALPLNPRKSLIAQTSYFKEVISMVANNLTSSLNLEIEVKLLLQGDGTTAASILLFLFHGMHFKEHGKSGTKEVLQFVAETEAATKFLVEKMVLSEESKGAESSNGRDLLGCCQKWSEKPLILLPSTVG